MSPLELVAIGYLLFNAVSSAYHAGKGDFKLTLSSTELKINAGIYGFLAALIVIFA